MTQSAAPNEIAAREDAALLRRWQRLHARVHLIQAQRARIAELIRLPPAERTATERRELRRLTRLEHDRHMRCRRRHRALNPEA